MNQQVMKVRALKGAPASIILALLVTGRSMTNAQLRQYTGYSDKPITEALALLDTEGITQYNGRSYGWSLSAGQMQLPGLHKLSTVGHNESLDRKVSDLTPTTTTTIDLEVQREVVVEEQKSEKLRSILLSAGVGQRSKGMKQLLAANIPIERAAAWVAYWRWWQRERERRPGPVDGRDYFTVGLLIRVLLDGDEAPAARCDTCLETAAECYCKLISH